MEPINAEEASLRGQAVEMFARLERELDAVISHYYTPGQPLSSYLHFDLLMAEGFSFGLRRDVFEAITRRHGWLDEKRMQHLRKAGRWRNFLAHVAGMEYHAVEEDGETPKIGYRDPRHPHDALTVPEAFARFEPECREAEAYVVEVDNKIIPMRRDWTWGHVVVDPVSPEDLYEDGTNANVTEPEP